MTNVCLCGIKVASSINDYVRLHKGKEITVLNVPHYYCENCKEYSFDTQDYVVAAVKYAHANQLTQIDLNQFKCIRQEQTKTL